MSFQLSTYVTLKDKFKSFVYSQKNNSSLFDSHFNSNDMETLINSVEKQIKIILDVFDFLDVSSFYSDDNKAAIIAGALIITKRKSDLKNHQNFIEEIDAVLGLHEHNKLKKSEELEYRNTFIKYKENNNYILPKQNVLINNDDSLDIGKQTFIQLYNDAIDQLDLAVQQVDITIQHVYTAEILLEEASKLHTTDDELKTFANTHALSQYQAFIKLMSELQNLIKNTYKKLSIENVKNKHSKQFLFNISCNSRVFSARLNVPPSDQTIR